MAGPILDFSNYKAAGPTQEQINEVRSLWRALAAAKYNGDLLILETYSSYSLGVGDPAATESLLSPGVDDIALGKAVLNALQQSRFLSFEEEGEILKKIEEHYDQWVQNLMKTYGYKTKRALFKSMKNCNIECKDDVITISPTNHERLEGWGAEGISKDDHVKIPADSPPEEIGAALRLAFSRCTGMGAD